MAGTATVPDVVTNAPDEVVKVGISDTDGRLPSPIIRIGGEHT